MIRRRALTLLEILIVLALLIAIAGVSIPAMTRRFENIRFDSTVDQIVATLALARAQAQEQRRPVQILWDEPRRALRAVLLDVGSLGFSEEGALEGGSSEALRSTRRSSASAENGQQDGTDRLGAAGAQAATLSTGGSRLRVVLPEGCLVRAGAAAAAEAPDGGNGGRVPDPSSVDRPDQPSTPENESISLVIFMPDGSTFGEASFLVLDGHRRRVRIEVNPWTGQAAVRAAEQLPAETPDAEAGEEP